MEECNDILIRCLLKNRSLREASVECNYSTRNLTRIFKKNFGTTFKKMQKKIVIYQCIEMILASISNPEISKKLFKGDLLYFYTFRKKNIGGRLTMDDFQKKAYKKGKILSELLNSQMPLTKKQLNCEYLLIKELRCVDNIDIISIPGRNGGYILDSSYKSSCISWINNVRVSRFTLDQINSFSDLS